MEFFPNRCIPLTGTRPALVESLSAPHVTFAPLPPTAPSQILPQPGTVVDLTFRLT
ncbi:hypothetical protein PHLCEN_2v6447 [Hermanssonia centrifuga]|uniref:Uncharacterized protein n=1 Tax=Hermanssonia centrifuga TaxID=98765 RepID=A0A2R6NZE4_9APHY|nr:hypothetical protein PHLCEN_2v6447 [Hermanssonia centrifuga]